jgi:predicted unusual protein kinase regulating ubiquinone biosynthesis (AarF/ABC1/UbiB family)
MLPGLVFGRLVLDPLFSGLLESIFHADPHAGNLMVQTQKHVPLTLVLPDWSQARRFSALLRHALIAPCLYNTASSVTGHRQTF